MKPNNCSRSNTPTKRDTPAPSNSETVQQKNNAASCRVEGVVESSSHHPYGAVKKHESSMRSQCCGYTCRPRMETQVEQSSEYRDIAVDSSGSFPCLHIALRGLREKSSYYLAIDFVEVMAGGEDKRTSMYTEPYYIPRPNHRRGAQWMKSTWYFDLKTIFNGWLETFGCKLRERGEYVPTVRVVEYPENMRHLRQWVTRIKLPSSAFMITSTRKPFTDRQRPKGDIHLALKSDTVSSLPTVAQFTEAAAPQPQPPPMLYYSSCLPTDMPYPIATMIPPPATERLQNDPALVPNWTPPTIDNSVLAWQLAVAQTTQDIPLRDRDT